MSISSKRSRRILALGVALAVAPVALKSSFAAESESEASAEPSGPKAVATVLVSPVPASEIATPLIRAGLTAEALSACGIPSTQVASILMAAVKEWQADPNLLPNADAGYADTLRKTDALRRMIRAGKATKQDIADYQTSMTALAGAEAARDAALSALRNAACSKLSTAQTQLLDQIHANKAWVQLPLEYRTVSRTEADWVKLRKALLDEKTCAKYDGDPDPALASHLANCKADATVATAKANCDATLGACKASWDSFLGL